MSSINAAKKRRANISQSTPVVGQQAQYSPNTANSTSTTRSSNALTLPQVLKMIDNRLVALEKQPLVSSQSTTVDTTSSEIVEELKGVIDEYEERFQMMANEIQNMKETVLKLQTYTMDVNKTLLEERVQIMSTQGKNETITMTEAAVLSTSETNTEEEEFREEDTVDENNETRVVEETDEFELSFSTGDNKKHKKKGKK
jgi:uncharacterized coiled-coil protein SlyX